MTIKYSLARIMRVAVIRIVSAFAPFLIFIGCQAEPIRTLTLTPTPSQSITFTPVPTVKPTNTVLACMGEGGLIQRIKIASNQLEGPFTFSVYTPPCYEETSLMDLPVLYLLHGQNMTDSAWLDLGVARIADAAIQNGQQPFMMVLPYEEKNFDPVGASKFDEAFIEELIPWIESNYRVCTDRACRSIGGISRGGGWAIHLALRNFQTFGAVGAHSMGLMAGDWWWVEHLLETNTINDFPRIYLDRGQDDFLSEDIDFFESVLTRNHVPHDFSISPGKHEFAYWQAHVKEYMLWYMAGWK
jgi:enterochelin esterase-like enzyme